MKLLVAFVSVAALAIPAHAGGALKAHLECTPDGGKPLKAKQKVALDKDITCAVVLDGGAVPGDAQVVIDAKVGTPIGAVKGHPHDAKATDAKRLTADPFKPSADFLNCGGLQIDASIAQGSKTLWSSSLVVSSACSPPKAIKAVLNCSADSSDKGYVSFPGNGDKLAAELGDGITCTIAGPTDEPTAHYGVLQIEGAPTPASIGLLGLQQGSKVPIVFNQFVGSSVPKCKSFVVDAAILDSDGGAMWQTKVPIAQACAKHK